MISGLSRRITHSHAAQGPFGSSGFKTGACQTPQSDFKIALFAQFGFWEKLKSEKVFGGDPILLSHFFLLPCVASRPLIYNFYCIFLKMSYNTASLKVKIPAKQPKPTSVKQPKPKSPEMQFADILVAATIADKNHTVTRFLRFFLRIKEACNAFGFWEYVETIIMKFYPPNYKYGEPYAV